MYASKGEGKAINYLFIKTIRLHLTPAFSLTRFSQRNHSYRRLPLLNHENGNSRGISIKFPIYSVKLLLLLLNPLGLLLILLLVVELLWLAFMGLGLTTLETFCDTLAGLLRRVLMRCWSVVNRPLRTS